MKYKPVRTYDPDSPNQAVSYIPVSEVEECERRAKECEALAEVEDAFNLLGALDWQTEAQLIQGDGDLARQVERFKERVKGNES